MADFALKRAPRVEIDPNSMAPSDPSLSVVLRGELPSGVAEGDSLLAVQPYGDGTEGTAPGVIVRLTEGLAYVRVDWQRQVDVPVHVVRAPRVATARSIHARRTSDPWSSGQHPFLRRGRAAVLSGATAGNFAEVPA